MLKGSDWETSKTCCQCGNDTNANRVERDLYVSPSLYGEDRSTGCVAQPFVNLFGRESGTLQKKRTGCVVDRQVSHLGTGGFV